MNKQTNKTIATTTTSKQSTNREKKNPGQEVFFLYCIPLRVSDDSECSLGNKYCGMRENKPIEKKSTVMKLYLLA